MLCKNTQIRNIHNQYDTISFVCTPEIVLSTILSKKHMYSHWQSHFFSGEFRICSSGSRGRSGRLSSGSSFGSFPSLGRSGTSLGISKTGLSGIGGNTAKSKLSLVKGTGLAGTALAAKKRKPRKSGRNQEEEEEEVVEAMDDGDEDSRYYYSSGASVLVLCPDGKLKSGLPIQINHVWLHKPNIFKRSLLFS